MVFSVGKQTAEHFSCLCWFHGFCCIIMFVSGVSFEKTRKKIYPKTSSRSSRTSTYGGCSLLVFCCLLENFSSFFFYSIFFRTADVKSFFNLGTTSDVGKIYFLHSWQHSMFNGIKSWLNKATLKTTKWFCEYFFFVAQKLVSGLVGLGFGFFGIAPLTLPWFEVRSMYPLEIEDRPEPPWLPS